MTAFDWAKIDDFKLKEVASGINNVNHSVGLNGQAAFVFGSITQTRPFFPCQNVSRENEESLLHLKSNQTLQMSNIHQDKRGETIDEFSVFQKPF